MHGGVTSQRNIALWSKVTYKSGETRKMCTFIKINVHIFFVGSIIFRNFARENRRRIPAEPTDAIFSCERELLSKTGRADRCYFLLREGVARENQRQAVRIRHKEEDVMRTDYSMPNAHSWCEEIEVPSLFFVLS